VARGVVPLLLEVAVAPRRTSEVAVYKEAGATSPKPLAMAVVAVVVAALALETRRSASDAGDRSRCEDMADVVVHSRSYVILCDESIQANSIDQSTNQPNHCELESRTNLPSYQSIDIDGSWMDVSSLLLLLLLSGCSLLHASTPHTDIISPINIISHSTI